MAEKIIYSTEMMRKVCEYPDCSWFQKPGDDGVYEDGLCPECYNQISDKLGKYVYKRVKNSPADIKTTLLRFAYK